MRVEREGGIHLGGDTAGNDLEDLLSELDEKVVHGLLDRLINAQAQLLGLGDGVVDQSLILGLLGGSEDEGGVGGSILRLVLSNG